MVCNRRYLCISYEILVHHIYYTLCTEKEMTEYELLRLQCILSAKYFSGNFNCHEFNIGGINFDKIYCIISEKQTLKSSSFTVISVQYGEVTFRM